MMTTKGKTSPGDDPAAAWHDRCNDPGTRPGPTRREETR